MAKKKTEKHRENAPLLLKQLAANPETLFAGAFRQQYAALCFRYKEDRADVEVLLVTSRDTRHWIIPKGWPMKGKKPHEAAAIEAWEEAGVRGRVRKTFSGRYTYIKFMDNGHVVPCIVDIHEIEVSTSGGQFKERGERTLAWVSLDEAARRVREIELKSFLVRFEPAKTTKKIRQKLAK